MSQTFRSLRHRNYRLYFFGQSISLIGNWIQSTGNNPGYFYDDCAGPLLPDIILISATMFSIGLLAFTNSTNLFLSLFTLAITGFGMIVILASCNTLLQTAINEDMRGRIVSLYSVAFMGFTPIGSLLSGAVAEVIGLQYTLSIAAVLCLLSAFWYYKHLSKIKKVVANYYK